MKKSITLIALLVAGCIHNSDLYHQNLRQLAADHESGSLGAVDYIRQRIQLDAKRGAETSKRFHLGILRYPALEPTHDPHMHGIHYKLIEDAKANGQLTDTEYQKLRQLAKEARDSRNERSRKRRMDRFRMGYR